MPELQKLTPETVAQAQTPPAKNIASSTAMSKQNTYPTKAFTKLVFFSIAIVLGIGTGYLVNKTMPNTTSNGSTAASINSSSLKVGDVIGINDKKAFPDSVEGVLDKGGMDGEGSHHLVRPGGLSQTVYLTSSVIDLDALVGHRIKVDGETLKAQKAGWLMDVGRVQILELNASKPE